MRRLALICVPLASLVLAACGTTTQTASFHGVEHTVAQTIANLQSDITSGEEKKICGTDLAASVVAKLGGKSGCESTVKDQVAEIDNTELEVESVKVSGETAVAKVKSDYAGKKVPEASVSLVKEGGKWKIASLIAPPHAPKSTR